MILLPDALTKLHFSERGHKLATTITNSLSGLITNLILCYRKWLEEIALANKQGRKPSLLRAMTKAFWMSYAPSGIMFLIQALVLKWVILTTEWWMRSCDTHIMHLPVIYSYLSRITMQTPESFLRRLYNIHLLESKSGHMNTLLSHSHNT